jgi:hypothetical protein
MLALKNYISNVNCYAEFGQLIYEKVNQLTKYDCIYIYACNL